MIVNEEQDESGEAQVISTSPGSLSFSEAVGPPMEERGGANALGLALERGAVSQLRLFELLDAVEMAVVEGRVGERPQMFSRL